MLKIEEQGDPTVPHHGRKKQHEFGNTEFD
jgi:hypothetical protein